MKNIVNRKLISKFAVLGSLAAVTLLIGHGCSELESVKNTTSLSSIGGLGGTTGGGVDGAGGGFTPIAGVSTVSLLYNKQMVDNMVLCTGIGTPSVATLDEWERRQSSFSEYGYATDVTAPMLMAVAAVAGEMCNDLLKLETVLPAASRRIFTGFDFNSGVAAVDAIAIGDASRRIARSCWARNEVSEELTIINEEILAGKVGVSATDKAQTRNLALMLCTSMLASLSGITL